MKLFTDHPQQQGISYKEHLDFSMGIALRLFTCTVTFALHAIFPFIGIKPKFDLEETARFIYERNVWIENTRLEQRSRPAHGKYLIHD